MEARRSRSAMSWADEVEKEEEEELAAKFEIQEKQKLNPFGAATRPREVILQERGINWRNIDQNFIKSRKEKPLKENVPAPTSQPLERKLKQKHKSNPKHKLENSEIASYEYQSSQGLQNNDDEFVPPIRYPPKNLVSYLFPTKRTKPGDDYFKSSSNNQHKIELKDDMKITSKRRNTFRY